jgi:hypothetical protein
VAVLASDAFGKVNNFNPVKKKHTSKSTIFATLFFISKFLPCLNDYHSLKWQITKFSKSVKA